MKWPWRRKGFYDTFEFQHCKAHGHELSPWIEEKLEPGFTMWTRQCMCGYQSHGQNHRPMTGTIMRNGIGETYT